GGLVMAARRGIRWRQGMSAAAEKRTARLAQPGRKRTRTTPAANPTSAPIPRAATIERRNAKTGIRKRSRGVSWNPNRILPSHAGARKKGCVGALTLPNPRALDMDADAAQSNDAAV